VDVDIEFQGGGARRQEGEAGDEGREPTARARGVIHRQFGGKLRVEGTSSADTKTTLRRILALTNSFAILNNMLTKKGGLTTKACLTLIGNASWYRRDLRFSTARSKLAQPAPFWSTIEHIPPVHKLVLVGEEVVGREEEERGSREAE